MILTEEHIQRIPERKKRELIRGEHARAEFAIHAQNQLKELLDQMPIRHGGEFKVRTVINGELAARYRVLNGDNCFHDQDFLKVLLRDNAFCRVVSTPDRFTLRVDGFRDEISRSGRRGAQPAPSAGPGGDPATPAPSGVIESGHVAAAASREPRRPDVRRAA